MTDHVGLSEEEFDELLDIQLDINPKNIALDLDYNSEPELTISLITKIWFRSITDKNAESNLEKPNDPENFDKCHKIPVPTIQYLNNRQPTEIGPPNIRKWKPADKSKETKFAKLLEKAYNHVQPSNGQDPDEKNGQDPEKFKLDLFQSTQLYTFKVPVRKWATAAKEFPVDLHRIRFSFSLKPMVAYSDNDKTSFEVMIPGRKSTGGALPAKKNFYPKIQVKQFPQNAENVVDETILEFDIHPNSFKIFGTHPREPVTKKTNFVISFLLVRHVLGPALNTLAPIYVIAFMAPFTCFFDLEGAFDDIAAYIVTLLLALVAHRIVITEAQQAIHKFTMSDFDFAICTLIIVIQMIIFTVICSMPMYNGERINEMKEQIEATLGLDLRLGPAQILFFVEESLIILWILIRVLQIVRAFNRLVHDNEYDLLETTDELTIAEYRQLRADREKMSHDLNKTVYLKSLFSTNLKILFRNALKSSNDSNEHQVATKLPTNDVYRCRFYQGEEASLALAKIKDDDKFKLVYADTVPKRTEIRNGTKTDAPETDKSEARAAKAVYSYSPVKGKTLLLEVQFLKDESVFTAESHKKYKEEKIRSGLEVLQKNESTKLTKTRVIMMYLKSLWVEIVSVDKHNFWSKCASDSELLTLMLRNVYKCDDTASIDSPEKDETSQRKDREKAAQEIKNLLETGNFEASTQM